MDDARAEALQNENDRLRARIEQLEAALGLTFLAPLEWGLTGRQTRLFGALMAREILTKQAAMTALYTDVCDDDEPQIKIIDVFICHIRRKVKPFGIEIHTVWGTGYRLTPESKARCLEQLGVMAA